MNRKTVKRVMTLLIVSIICSVFFSFVALAVSDSTSGSITITTFDKKSKEVINGVVYRLYFLASASVSGDDISYIYDESFKGNGMQLGNLSDEYLPIHLAVYAEKNGIDYVEKTTDSEGAVVFDNLSHGAYLIVSAEIEEGYLKPKAFIISVPTKDEVENAWVYNVKATPKIEDETDENDEKTYISVKKYWENTENIPDHITVSLIKDGTVVDTIVLDSNNDWYYRWDNLDKNHSWSVIEDDVPDGYTVSYSTTQMTVIITNISEDPDTPDVPDTPDNPGTPDDPDTPENPEELIPTGQLNWPIPVLTIAGLVFFSIGWAMLNLGKEDEETV